MKKTYKIPKGLSVLVLSLILLLTLLPAGAASESGYASPVEKLLDPDGPVVGVAARGLWHQYPENSLEGLVAAAGSGLDFVLTDVRMTSDGVLICFRDEDTSRMCAGDEVYTVSSTGYEILSGLPLRSFSGGGRNAATEYSIPRLEDVFDAFAGFDCGLMLSCSPSLAGEIASLAKERAVSDKICLLCCASAEDVGSAVVSSGGLPVIGVKKGNVVFDVTKYVDDVNSANGAGVVLKTANRYGVNFNQTVLKHFYGSMRAAADLTDTQTAGWREDTEKWWNDLISRGYSLIITDYPLLFADYLEGCRRSRETLAELYGCYTRDWSLPEFGTVVFNDYKKAYTDAVADAQKLLADRSSSKQDLDDCIFALQSAVDAIDENYDALTAGTESLTVTPARICLCIGAAAVVTAVQVYFWKKRRKA